MKASTAMFLFVVPILGLVLACGGGQTAEANKLIDEANALVKSYNEDDAKAVPLMKDFAAIAGLSSADDIEEFKSKNKSKVDDLQALIAKLQKTSSDAADRFEQASKMDLEDKAKEYYSVQGQSMRKTSDLKKVLGDWVKSIMDAKDPDEVSKLFDDFAKKRDASKKETDELNAKADQIIKDNPQVFKK